MFFACKDNIIVYRYNILFCYNLFYFLYPEAFRIYVSYVVEACGNLVFLIYLLM